LQLWRHKIGTDPSEDALVFHEEDGAFYLGLGKTESDRYIIVSPGSAVTSNALFLDADTPERELQVLAPRVQNVEVSVSCWASVQTTFCLLSCDSIRPAVFLDGTDFETHCAQEMRNKDKRVLGNW
jgi:protease II